MFASNNLFKDSIRLILISVFLCVSQSQAQQQSKVTYTSSPSPIISPGNDEVVLLDEDQNQKLQQLLSHLAVDPEDKRILEQLDTLLVGVLNQVNGLINEGSFQKAEQLLSVIQSVNPGLPGLNTAKNRLQTIDEVNELLQAGNTALASQQILEPENNNALYYFKQALAKDPRSRSAQLGLVGVQGALVDLALESAREFDFETAGAWLLEASAIRDDQKLVDDARIEVVKLEWGHAAELEQKAIEAMDSGNFKLADFSIIALIALGGQESRVKSLRARLEEARIYGGFEPGQVISDKLLHSGGSAPEITIIAAGSFLMGSQGRSDDAYHHEEPQHRVTIEQGFGLGVKEVSVAEFRLFVERSGYRTAAEQSGSSSIYDETAGRLSSRAGIDWEYDYKGNKAGPDMPVLHVNVHDALAYVGWLTAETGKAYRLPSEAEYEYVARAGGSGTYWWGEGSPTVAVENLTGEHDKSPGNREWTTAFKKYGDGHWGPAPTGSVADAKLVHPMGVFDITGNVSEWTEDCWHQNYIKAPVDGSAWVNPGCKRRVVRGGYWASAPEKSRAASRISALAETHGPVVGIRIARDL